MKKLLSILLVLTLVLSVCSFAAFAEDPDPEDPGDLVPEYGDFISLQYTNEDGTPAYYVDPQWGAVIIQQQVIYDKFSDKAEEIAGITYYPETSTLVLTDLQAANRILYLSFVFDTLNLKVVGDCHLGMIEGNGSGLRIYGTGSLTVNENKFYDSAIELDSQRRDISLNFDTDVTVTLYEGENTRTGAAVIRDAQAETPADRITFDGTHNGTLKKADNERQGEQWIDGYKKAENHSLMNLGDRIKRKSDPQGLYAGGAFTEEDGTQGVFFRKYIYVNSLGGFLPDPSFADPSDEDYYYEVMYGDSVYMDEFGDDLSFELDENNDKIPLYNDFDFDSHINLSVKTDDKGNRYAVWEDYDESTGDWIETCATYEEITELPGFYVITPVDGVNIDALENLYDNGIQVRITGYTLKEPDNSTYIGEKVTSDDDPDGIYGCSWRWDEGSQDVGEFITKYLYDEEHGVYVEDRSFNPILIESEDFFDNGPYHLVQDAYGNSEYLTYSGYNIEDCGGRVAEDAKGNRYAIGYSYDNGSFTAVAYTYEPLTVGSNLYFFTLAEDVDPGDLTVVEDYFPIEGEYNFILSGQGGVFVYSGRQTGATFSISGKVLTYLKERGDHAEVKLYQAGSTEPLASQVMDGCEAPYLFEGLTAGKYVLSVDKAYHIARDFEVTISADTTLELKINPLGDFTLDGKVNIRDVNSEYNYVKDSPEGIDEYAIKCGDVERRDNKVNIRDVNTLYNHVKGSSSLYQ